MRTDGTRYPVGHHAHYHNGGTCHGLPTLEEAADEAVKKSWVGKILEITDQYATGREVKCYSAIVGSFDTHERRGKYVAEVVTIWRRL